jgi:predicted permease
MTVHNTHEPAGILERFGKLAYRALLTLLPRTVRSHLQSELLCTFVAGQRHCRKEKGVGAVLWFTMKELGGVLLMAVRARRTGPALQLNGDVIVSPVKRSTSSGWLGDLGRDLRFALRGLTGSRGFALIAVMSLAVGIGVNTGVFTIFHATWLEPVPGVRGPDRVVELLVTRRGIEYEAWAYPDFQDVTDTETPIAMLAGWKDREGTLGTADGGQRVRVMYVSASYFRVLGIIPPLGRDFLVSEDVGPGQHPVAVVSHDMWQNRLGGDPDVIGQTITLNRTPYTVVGVAPAAFKGHRVLQQGTDLWVPLMQDSWVAGANHYTANRHALWLRVLGRLRPGATVDEASASLQTVFARLAEDYPESNQDRRARAASFGPVPARGRAASLLATRGLFALLGVVLLIICSNVAGMVLARSAARERELGVRLALGSSRRRLVRLLMVEALLLALAGGGLGTLLAFWVTSDVLPAMVTGIPDLGWGPNSAILAYSLALTLSTTLVFGLFPAIRFSRPQLISVLKDDAGGGGRRVGRVHRLAASAQTGVALVLLLVCSVCLRAVGVMDHRELGFDPHGLLMTRIDLSQQGHQSLAEAGVFLDRMMQSIGSLSGVQSVSLADGVPLDLVGNYTSVSRADRAEEQGGRVRVEFTRASEGFFEVIGTPILRGRGFETTDRESSEPVVVITETLAGRLWPGEPALGRRLRFALSSDSATAFTVVGVALHVASSRPTEDQPHVFAALRQNYWPRIMIVVRAIADPQALVRPIQSAILDVDPRLPIPEVVTSESLVSHSTESQRLTARVAGALGLLALLLAAIGVYGVVALVTANRAREIGVRMALGATRERVLGAVLRDAVRLATPGLAVGALLAVGFGFAMRSVLLGVSPLDPISFGSVGAVLFLVVLLASLIPARRAARIDPMNALRCE